MSLKLSLILSSLLALLPCAHAGEILVARLPKDALQPRTAATPEGGAAVVFVQGDPKAGELMLATVDTAGRLGPPLKISTQASRAVAIGTVRGPALALGAAGNRHVVWFGAQGSGHGGGSALFYSRVDAAGAVSEPRDLMGGTLALDGGADVVADGKGNVWLIWHALPAGKEGQREGARRLFVRHSADDGRSFGEPWEVPGINDGICGCCGLAAALDARGAIHVLYRMASAEGKERGIRHIRFPWTGSAGGAVERVSEDRWEMPGCPMTTAQFAPLQDGVAAAWVTQFRLSFSGWQPNLPESKTPRNHPRLARNTAGETLLAWTEGSGWGKGGQLVAQRFDANGAAVGRELREKLPAWHHGACLTLQDGRLLLVY